MIRKARIQDLPNVYGITRACAADMINNGIHQWNESYPSEEILKKDILNGELYVLEIDNQTAGMIVLTATKDKEYEAVQWLTPDSNNLYVHRLAVHPAFQHQGHARKLMDFAEKYAVDNGYLSVRLDTFSQNQRNQTFYEKRGYKRLGEIYFPEQSKHPFYCYEKILRSSNTGK